MALLRKSVLASLGACLLACGFDASGIGSSGDIGDTSGDGHSMHESGADESADPSGVDDGELDTNPEGPGTDPDGPSTGSDDDDATGGPVCGDWWNPAWTRRREVIVPDTKLEAALADVPVMVLLDSTRIDYAATQIGGTDLRFVDAAGLPLAHEFETWDPDGSSFVWLRLPTISPTGQPQPRIHMYYGNPGALDETTPEAVWNADFVSVHHMRSLVDATANGHDGESISPPLAVEGWIGGAQSFDGTDDHVELTGEPAYDLTTAITIEAWIRVALFDTYYQAIVTKGDDSWRLHREATSDFVGFGTDTDASDNDNLGGTISVNDGGWHYLVAVFGAGEKRLYVDGMLDSSVSYAGPIKQGDFDVLIGENQQNYYRFFQGEIDEVRISSVPRGRAWISVQTDSMNDALLEYGPEETCP